MLLKICGVTRKEDAEYLDGKVDYVGFIPDPAGGARSVGSRIYELIGSIRESTPVAVFAEEEPIAAARLSSRLGAVMQHPALSDELALKRVLSAIPGLRLAPVVYVSRDAVHRASKLLELYGNHLEYVLIDAPKRGFSVYEMGLKFPPSMLDEVRGLRIGVAGGIGPSNVGIVASRDPFLIDISSGVELGPGIKDAAKIDAVIKVVKG